MAASYRGEGVADMPSGQSGGVFISYRREDTSHLAGRLRDRLIDHFGPKRVFMDVYSIQPGDDFSEVIAGAVGSCDVLLVLIGKHWLTVTDPGGRRRRRLDNPDDFVRLEIETAFKNNIRVIPVLVDGVTMPTAADLPPRLAPMARLQAVEVTHSDFDDKIRRMVELLT